MRPYVSMPVDPSRAAAEERQSTERHMDVPPSTSVESLRNDRRLSRAQPRVPYTGIHRLVRRFLEPAQDIIVVLLVVALFGVMVRALLAIGSDVLASELVFRDVISQALFILVLLEVERLLIIYLRDHHVSVDVMVEATIVGALREVLLLIAVGVEVQRLLALTVFVLALAVVLRLGDLRAPPRRVRVHGARQRDGGRHPRRP